MLVSGEWRRSLWLAGDGWAVEAIDQTQLPHALAIARFETADEVANAIRTMIVRGAPLIGAAAAYGFCLALRTDASDPALIRARTLLLATRPTAVNLRWALDQMQEAVTEQPPANRVAAAYRRAADLSETEVRICAAIGAQGLPLIQRIWQAQQRPVRILTHCNAGWLATVDWGTALAPIFKAHQAGIPVHVFVDETRPRNQGASLTAWELVEQGIPHTVIVDNAGGHLMQRGQIDLCLVGSDRTTRRGDVCNKIGTYLKALAARAHDVPFYVALPSSTIDWTIDDGVAAIPIEERSADEVRWVSGRDRDGHHRTVEVLPPQSAVANPAFDVTPAGLVTALITERGVCGASITGLRTLYPEQT